MTTPWTRPGEIPWVDDEKFDLLLLGSDAGTDRWSRRMDVMLLVEVDVATGRIAMFGFPRNMVNVPLPPGAARNASPSESPSFSPEVSPSAPEIVAP